MYLKLLTACLLILVSKTCLAQQIIDNNHKAPSSWGKMRIGNTRITLESPGVFRQELRNEKIIGNTVSFSSKSQYALYIVNEQKTISSDTALLNKYPDEMLGRLQAKFPDAHIKSRRRANVQGFPAIKVEISATYSGYKMRICYLFIQGGKMIWSVQGSSIDEARPNSEVNYLLSTVEIEGAPLSKVYAANVYTYVEKMPCLSEEGGIKAIVDSIQKNIRYPQSAFQNKIEGKVFLSFIVTPEGNVIQIKILKGVEASLNNAAVDAVKKLPRFIPGEQGGKKVYVSYTVPITFTALTH